MKFNIFLVHPFSIFSFYLRIFFITFFITYNLHDFFDALILLLLFWIFLVLYFFIFFLMFTFNSCTSRLSTHFYLLYCFMDFFLIPCIFLTSFFFFFGSDWFFIFSIQVCLPRCWQSAFFNEHLMALRVKWTFINCTESAGKHCNKVIVHNFPMSQIYQIVNKLLCKNLTNCHSHL